MPRSSGFTALTRLPIRTLGAGGRRRIVVDRIIATFVGRRLATRGRLLTTGPVVALVVALVLVGSTSTSAPRGWPPAGSVSERAAAAEINAWIRANVPPGSTVAIGPDLGMAIAIDLPAGYRAAGLRHYLAVADPTAAWACVGRAARMRDFIAIDTAPGKANDFNVYDATTLDGFIRTQQPDFLVYSVNLASSSLSILALLTPDRGFTEVARFDEDVPSGDIETHVYRVDRDRLDIRLRPDLDLGGGARPADRPASSRRRAPAGWRPPTCSSGSSRPPMARLTRCSRGCGRSREADGRWQARAGGRRR